MSSVDFKAALQRLVNSMRGAGYTIPEIVAIVLDEPNVQTAQAPRPNATRQSTYEQHHSAFKTGYQEPSKTEAERIITVQLANGGHKQYPASMAEQIARDQARDKANKVTAVNPELKPVVTVLDTPRFNSNTTFDQDRERLSQPWSGPIEESEPSEPEADPTEESLEALIAKTKADLQELLSIKGDI